MLLHTEDRPQLTEPDDSAEALIREARGRTRRRRLRRAAVLAALVGIGSGLYVLVGGGAGGVIAESASAPYANLHAFKGQGELAFVSRGRVWALDGTNGTLRRLPTPIGSTPSSPVLSHDGRWLAYLVHGDHNQYGPYELWIARADGTGAHRVPGLTVTEPVGWSPTSDLMAVEAGEAHYPNGSPTAVDLVSPDGHTRALFMRSRGQILRRGGIGSVVWSPDGASLAVSTYSPERYSGTQILDVPIAAGARPTVWFSLGNRQRLKGALSCGSDCGGTDAIAQLAGWWPQWGVGFWLFDSGMTHNSDSTPLAFISGPHAPPRLIAQTLSDGTTDAVSAGPNGQLAAVASGESAGREYGYGKTVERCSARTVTCTPLPAASTWTGRPLQCKPCFDAPANGPGSAVSLDPAWSPNGTSLAYVKAPAWRSAGFPTLAWFGTHWLYVWNSRTNSNQRIGTITGSSLPTWSRDGKSLLYVSGDGLWLANATTGKAIKIEQPLYPESLWKKVSSTTLGFYGQIPWSQQFSWHTG
jgi:WD40-like Beta Propeller Repeat